MAERNGLANPAPSRRTALEQPTIDKILTHYRCLNDGPFQALLSTFAGECGPKLTASGTVLWLTCCNVGRYHLLATP
jgi:hypothetical protein